MTKAKQVDSIIIIGAGAGGLASAIQIKKNCKENVSITLLEHCDKIGRKILVSGNGRCNLLNSNISADYYNNPHFLKEHLKEFNFIRLKNFYEELGLFLSPPDNDGRVYPYNYTASSVVELYKSLASSLNINIVTGCTVTSFEPMNDKAGFKVNIEGGFYQCDYLIVATGSKAYTDFDSGFLKNHFKINRLCGALGALNGKKGELKYLENVKVKGDVSVDLNGERYTEAGEVLFKSDRISGIVIFNISSRLIWNKIDKATIHIDTLSDFSRKLILDKLIKNRLLHKRAVDILIGLVPFKVAMNVLSRLGIEPQSLSKDLTEKELNAIVDTLKSLNFSTMSDIIPKNAQVMSGGVDLSEVNNTTFETKKYKNMFIIGEVLDIDGVSGGYNLHFAVSSALATSKRIEELINATDK